MLERVGAAADELVVEVLLELVVLRAARCVRGSSSANSGPTRIGARSSPSAFQWSIAPSTSSSSCVADRLVERAEAELGEVLAHLLGDELEEVHDELRLAAEARAQLGVLGGDADRAGVEVADAHHDAARDDERRGREAELLGAEQRADDDVAAGLHLAVDLHDDAVAHAVEHERLLGLGEAELPRRARVLERVERARAGAAVVAGDEHDVGQGLRDAGRDRADARLAHELDVHAGVRVGALEVEDQLLEVFDRVDVVVRRRRDEADARGRVAGARDPRVDLGRRQLAALAGLGALRQLDLDVGRRASGTCS